MKDTFDNDMKRFRKEMNHLFDSFWEGGELSQVGFRQPLSDVKEKGNDVIASIEIPGVDKKDIELRVTEHDLEVKAEKKKESEVKKKGYVSAERAYSGFYRRITLPDRVMPDKAKASYKDGVLEVVMPKAERGKVEKAKKIAVH